MKVAYIGTPGLRRFLTLPGEGPVRALYTSSDLRGWAVQGSGFYSIFADGSFHLLGSLNTATGPVSLADNGVQLVLVDGPYGYQIPLAGGPFAGIDDENFPGADRVEFLDGYLVFNRPASGVFFLSPLYAVMPFDGLAFATAESSPDRLVGHMVNHGNLWLGSTGTTEIWYNAGGADFPFARLDGGVLETGLAAAQSWAKGGEAVFWLGQDARGAGTVWTAQGYQPKRISTHAIDHAIQGYSRINDALGWTEQREGHLFYWLTFPTGNATWVYDANTELWHERSYRNPQTNELGRHRANCHTFAFGRHLVGDYADGRIYELDLDYYSDDGDPLPAIRQAPHLADTGGSLALVHYKRFQVDLEPGVGLALPEVSMGVSLPEEDPQIMLQWSNDGGHTFGTEMWTSMGKIGETRRRAVWHRLGAARDRVFLLAITAAVKRAILGAYVDVEKAIF